MTGPTPETHEVGGGRHPGPDPRRRGPAGWSLPLGPAELGVVALVGLLVAAGLGVFGGRSDGPAATSRPSVAAVADGGTPGPSATPGPTGIDGCAVAGADGIAPGVELVVAGGTGIPSRSGGGPGPGPVLAQRVVVPAGASLAVRIADGSCGTAWRLTSGPSLDRTLPVPTGASAGADVVLEPTLADVTDELVVQVTVHGTVRSGAWMLLRRGLALPGVRVTGPGVDLAAVDVPCDGHIGVATDTFDTGCPGGVDLGAAVPVQVGSRLAFSVSGPWTVLARWTRCLRSDGRLASLVDAIDEPCDRGDADVAPTAAGPMAVCQSVLAAYDGIGLTRTWCIQVRGTR